MRGVRGRSVDPQQPRQALGAQLGGGSGGQVPVPIAVDVDQVRLEALPIDGAQHRLGRRDADLVLGRLAAGEDPDSQAAAPAGRAAASHAPTHSISYASRTPKRSATVARTKSPRARTSAARPPRSVTMKLACRVLTAAVPSRWPFSPAASISRPAWSPAGLRKTLPAFWSASGCVACRVAWFAAPPAALPSGAR